LNTLAIHCKTKVGIIRFSYQGYQKAAGQGLGNCMVRFVESARKDSCPHPGEGRIINFAEANVERKRGTVSHGK